MEIAKRRLLLTLLPFLLSCVPEGNDESMTIMKYPELECSLGDDYVFIAIDENGTGNIKREYVIDKAGITFRVSPTYYAKPASQIEGIYFDIDSGSLSVHVRDDGEQYTEEVGKISVTCWENIRKAVGEEYNLLES